MQPDISPLPFPFLSSFIFTTFFLSFPSSSLFSFPPLLPTVLSSPLFHVASLPSFNHSLSIPRCHSERRCYVIQSSVRESLWASRRLSLIHQQPIHNCCCFFFNSKGCYLKISLTYSAVYHSQNIWLQHEQKVEWTFCRMHGVYMCLHALKMSQLCVSGSFLSIFEIISQHTCSHLQKKVCASLFCLLL